MRSMPSSPSPGNSGGSVGGGVRPLSWWPVDTGVTALGGGSTVPDEVIMFQNRRAYREFALSATTNGRILRLTRNSANVRLVDTCRRHSGLLGSVDPAYRRIPALRARYGEQLVGDSGAA